MAKKLFDNKPDSRKKVEKNLIEMAGKCRNILKEAKVLQGAKC